MLTEPRESSRRCEQRSREVNLRAGSRGAAFTASAFLSVGFHAWLLFLWPVDLAFEPAEYGVARGDLAIEVALVEAPPAAEESPVDTPETVPPPEEVKVDEAPPEINDEPLPPIPSPTPEMAQEVIKQEPVQEIHSQPAPAATPRARRKSASKERKESLLEHGAGAGSARQVSAASMTSGSPMTQAAYLFNPHPLYPEASRKAGHTGVVVLRVSVSERGRVTALRIIKSSGFSLLDERARTTVLRWTFKPARRDGRPVSTQVDVPIRFRLDR